MIPEMNSTGNQPTLFIQQFSIFDAMLFGFPFPDACALCGADSSFPVKILREPKLLVWVKPNFYKVWVKVRSTYQNKYTAV